MTRVFQRFYHIRKINIQLKDGVECWETVILYTIIKELWRKVTITEEENTNLILEKAELTRSPQLGKLVAKGYVIYFEYEYSRIGSNICYQYSQSVLSRGRPLLWISHQSKPQSSSPHTAEHSQALPRPARQPTFPFRSGLSYHPATLLTLPTVYKFDWKFCAPIPS